MLDGNREMEKRKSGSHVEGHGLENVHQVTPATCRQSGVVSQCGMRPSVRRSTFGTRAFAIAGPTVWNSLPDSLRDPAVGPDQFRRDLKTHLFE